MQRAPHTLIVLRRFNQPTHNDAAADKSVVDVALALVLALAVDLDRVEPSRRLRDLKITNE